MKFTQRDFVIFKKECERCVEKLGLKEWRVDIEFKPTKHKTAYAATGCYDNDKIAEVWLNSEAKNTKGHDVRESAKHEILEVLLHPLGVMAEYGYPERMVDKERHAIIRSLEKIL